MTYSDISEPVDVIKEQKDEVYWHRAIEKCSLQVFEVLRRNSDPLLTPSVVVLHLVYHVLRLVHKGFQFWVGLLFTVNQILLALFTQKWTDGFHREVNFLKFGVDEDLNRADVKLVKASSLLEYSLELRNLNDVCNLGIQILHLLECNVDVEPFFNGAFQGALLPELLFDFPITHLFRVQV